MIQSVHSAIRVTKRKPMEFARPIYLYLLALLPLAALLLAWAARRKRADVARLGTPALIATLSASVSVTRRRWKIALWFIALIALIVALARPRWGTQVQVTVQRGVQVMVALDVSSSMLAEDIKPNRLTRAKLTVEELMDRLGGNELGLVLFAGAAFVQFPLTADFNTARSFLEAAGPWTISRPGTALEEALHVALRGFPEGVAGNRVILLLTDGEGHEGDPLDAAGAAAEAGVTIYAIGFGSPDGEPIPIRDQGGVLTGYKKDAQGETVLSRLDETTLGQIVNATNGLYFRASASGDEIAAITDAIAALDTGELESQFETQGVERFEWFAGLALLALTAEFLIGERVRRET
jgi:Ca-activated chloride channel family protein